MGFETIHRSIQAEWQPEEFDPRVRALRRLKQARHNLSSVGSDAAAEVLARNTTAEAPEHTPEYVEAERAVEQASADLQQAISFEE